MPLSRFLLAALISSHSPALLIASDGRLTAPAEIDEGAVFFGLGTSLGEQRRVTAPVTFDRRKAAEGGLIYAAPFMTREDGEAIRMAAGILTTSGGALSLAAIASREHGVGAVILGQATWQGNGSDRVFSLDQPVFGAEQSASGLKYQVVEKTIARAVREGDVLTLEPERGAVRLYPPGEQASRLALAQAMLAYDGLKDAQSLITWLEDQKAEATAAALAPWLIDEMAERLSDGTSSAEDFLKVRGIAAREMAAPALRDFQKRLWAREQRRSLIFLRRTLESARAAASAAAAERLSLEAEKRWAALRALAQALGAGGDLGPASGLYHAVESETRRKMKALAEKSAGLAEVALGAGAAVPKAAALGARFYRKFVAENGLSRPLEEISSDASIDLRRKASRIRELMRAKKLSASLTSEIDGLVPSSWEPVAVLSFGERRTVPRSELSIALVSAWADLWGPGPLGLRKRAARALSDEEATVTVGPVSAADISGSILTRAANNSRSRMTISAGLGDLDEVAAGKVALDEYVADPVTGVEILPAVLAGPKRVLSMEQVARLARLGRALENHFGYGVEARFFFKGDSLFLSQASPLRRTF